MAVDAAKKGRGAAAANRHAKKPDDGKPSEASIVADPERNWADDPQSEPFEKAEKLLKLVQKQFDNQEDQQDHIQEYWNIYNAMPDENQQYNGNTQGYIPAVRDCVNARTKRALKQLFPTPYRHVEGLSSDGSEPTTQLSLLEHYIRKTHLKSVVRCDLIAGDVTGQWNLMIDWSTSVRCVTNLVKRNPIIEQIDGEDVKDLGISDPTEEVEDTETDEVVTQAPEIVDFCTEDLAVIPPTCNDLQKAKAVVVRTRFSKAKFQELVDNGVFILPEGSEVKDFCKPDERRDRKNPQKRALKSSFVKGQGTDEVALVYVTFTRLKMDEEYEQEAIVYYGNNNTILGIIVNPLWSGKRPLVSAPVEQQRGSFFGRSKIEPVKFLQWNLTDFWNMGQDSAMYSLLPIWAVDPLKCPQWSQLTMGLAAIWPVVPDGIKPLTAPQLWKDSVAICENIKRQIWESMDVNEMMMGKMPQGRKNNALIGGVQQEQATNIMDHASRYEDEILNPLVEMLFEFDQQFRTTEITVEQRGEIGVKAQLQEIPVPQWGEKYVFRWVGTEFMQSQQRMQMGIAWMNVLRGIPPQMLNGRKLDVTPILTAGTEALFGPEMAPRILIDQRNQFTVPPEIENEMLFNGFNVEVHEADEDPQHLQAHMQAAARSGDPQALFKTHMMMHAQQLQTKRQTAMAQQMQMGKGVPGAPGGAGPGVPGQPRPGAMPGSPQGGQNPSGAIPQDQMVSPGMMGRG